MTLDEQERDILDSFERGEWQTVKNAREETARHVGYAKATLRKGRRVNIPYHESQFSTRR